MIQVLYTCDACGIRDRPVTVAHRKEGEGLLPWMDDVAQRVGMDHRTRSPHCTAAKVTNVKIPMHSEKGVGMNPRGEEK